MNLMMSNSFIVDGIKAGTEIRKKIFKKEQNKWMDTL